MTFPPDRVAARRLIALADRLVRDVDALLRDHARPRVDTFAVDATVRFGSARDRAAFAEELATTIARLVSVYHRDHGRAHRLVVAVHPEVEAGRVAS
jgi:hypothetical protein